MRLLLGLLLFFGVLGCAGSAPFRLSIPRDLTIAPRVERSMAWVESDRPAGLDSEEMVIADVLLAIAADKNATSGENTSRAHASERVWSDLRTLEIRSTRYLTEYRSKPAWHQVTIGVVNLPYETFVARFDPAADWGRNLDGYLGGELSVDQRAQDGRAALQRERMVLGTPWYAIGSPDLDMEKYEVITRTASSTRIAWIVTASPNASVEIDVGYLLFRGITLDSGGATLVAFNSVHRIDSGLFSFESGLVGDNIEGTFVAHVERYREVAQVP